MAKNKKEKQETEPVVTEQVVLKTGIMGKPEVDVKIVTDNPRLPSYIDNGAAGLDLECISYEYDQENDTWIYDTGVKMEIPKGYVGLLLPKSSIYKHDALMANTIGVIDSSYRGNIKVLLRSTKQLSLWERFKCKVLHQNWYNQPDYIPGDRVAQLVIVPCPPVKLIRCDELSKTERGEKGFGEMDNTAYGI